MAANYRHKTGVCKAGETFLTHIVGWVVEKMCVRRENFLQKNPTRKFLMHSRFCNFVLKIFCRRELFCANHQYWMCRNDCYFATIQISIGFVALTK